MFHNFSFSSEISLEAYFDLCLWTFIVETLKSLPLILVSGSYGGHHPAYFLWIWFICSTLKSIIYMSGNVGLYPRYCEWFAVEKLTKYTLWDKSSLWIFFIVLNSYLSNGYTDTFSITSWSAKPEVFTLWPSKKTFAEPWLWILLYSSERQLILFHWAINFQLS